MFVLKEITVTISALTGRLISKKQYAFNKYLVHTETGYGF